MSSEPDILKGTRPSSSVSSSSHPQSPLANSDVNSTPSSTSRQSRSTVRAHHHHQQPAGESSGTESTPHTPRPVSSAANKSTAGTSDQELSISLSIGSSTTNEADSLGQGQERPNSSSSFHAQNQILPADLTVEGSPSASPVGGQAAAVASGSGSKKKGFLQKLNLKARWPAKRNKDKQVSS